MPSYIIQQNQSHIQSSCCFLRNRSRAWRVSRPGEGRYLQSRRDFWPLLADQT